MARVRQSFPDLFTGNKKTKTDDEDQKKPSDDVQDPPVMDDNMDISMSLDDDEPEATPNVNKRVRDMFGNFIIKGNYISYPGRKGSDTYMRTAKVLEVTERNLDGDNTESVLKLAVAMAPRWSERKNNPNWETKIVKVTMCQFYRSVVIPQSYIQNDDRYDCLLEA